MTLKRMERAGRLPALKIGRSVRYRLADIERIEAESAVR
jgi:DNA-binding transcriptional regulator PaaX